MVTAPRTRGLELARQLEQMSPAARRLLTESSRWWPRADGGIAFCIDADGEDADALRELCDTFANGLGLEVQHLGPDEVLPAPGGSGLSFAEMRQLPRNER
jgi:hypothetical protein